MSFVLLGVPCVSVDDPFPSWVISLKQFFDRQNVLGAPFLVQVSGRASVPMWVVLISDGPLAVACSLGSPVPRVPVECVLSGGRGVTVTEGGVQSVVTFAALFLSLVHVGMSIDFDELTSVEPVGSGKSTGVTDAQWPLRQRAFSITRWSNADVGQVYPLSLDGSLVPVAEWSVENPLVDAIRVHCTSTPALSSPQVAAGVATLCKCLLLCSFVTLLTFVICSWVPAHVWCDGSYGGPFGGEAAQLGRHPGLPWGLLRRHPPCGAYWDCWSF